MKKNLPKQKKLSYTMNTDGRTDGRTDRMNDNDIRFSTKTAKSYWHLRHPENGYGHTQFHHTFVHSLVRPFVCPSVYFRVLVTSNSQVNVFMHINWLVKLKLKWYRKYAAFFQRIIGNCLWRCFLFWIKQLTPLFLYSANNFFLVKKYTILKNRGLFLVYIVIKAKFTCGCCCFRFFLSKLFWFIFFAIFWRFFNKQIFWEKNADFCNVFSHSDFRWKDLEENN